jgi:hypothetical protein
MQQVDQDLQPLPHDTVRASPLDVDDKSDAAGVMFIARIVQASCVRGTIGDGLVKHKRLSAFSDSDPLQMLAPPATEKTAGFGAGPGRFPRCELQFCPRTTHK